MSMLFPKKVCLFSGFTGQITFEGKPLSNVRVKRNYSFENKRTEEETTTDDQGYFTFESAWAKTRAPFIAQFVAEQNIYVYFQGEEYHIWTAGKMAEEEFGEFGGEPESFACELTEEQYAPELEIGLVYTNCRWQTK
ncbi:DUF6795 domain-containing protein [Teredinibacter sp. KSP-S5-2]|uniref:DUF6795 domain-containing protein n=1 Tax=Teredinibacter sp. KSP-S5-2 TaxID=3034506 RepID=UPI00293466AF|nr:DUF6795 domain-containing protein [Teredinibacter sp. KSP-S5-2]WNO08050.1 hypothetical protein P5V12_13795 [Teredinibacter sp. KSP-S5-2]